MKAKTPVFRFDNVNVDAAEFRVSKDGEQVILEPKAFQVLIFLLENRGRLIPKDELLDAVWSDSFVTPNALTRVVAQIRRALGDTSQNSRYIETVPTRGYRFIAEVEEIDVPPAGGDVLTVPASEELPSFEMPQFNVPVRQSDPPPEPSARESRRFSAAAALVVIAVAGIAYFLFTKNPAKIGTDPAASEQSIAVLPFKLINPNDENGYLSIGLADSLITKLSNVHTLTVRPTASVIRYASTQAEAADAGRALNVATVIDGAVQRDNDRIRVTVQMIRVADGKPIWANSYDTRFVNIFQVQDEISARITEALKLRLSVDERTRFDRPATNNIDAFQSYLQGNDNLGKLSPDNLKRAIDNFGEAIELDPNYALAYAKLANAYALAASFNVPSARELAEKNALKAIELDPNLAEAHTSLAALQFWDYHDISKAQDSFVHSLELNPNSSYAHVYYGWFLVATAHFDEAERHLRRAVELDPLSQNNIADQGLPFYYSRRYDEARRFYKQSLEADEKFWYGHMRLAEACEAVGDAECAVAEAKRAVELSPLDPALRCELIRMLALAGRKDEARKLLAEVTAKDAPPRPYFVALAYAALDQPDEVFAALDRALAEKDSWICWIKVDPRLDSLRRDPRFDGLVTRTNLK